VQAAGCRLIVTVLPHAYTTETYGAGTFEGFLCQLGDWCREHDAGFVNLSSMVPREAFGDAVHFDREYIPLVCERLAQAVASDLRGRRR
ncbi:MAG TPA: hypothetical protein PLQ54_20895, partial [Armatimonadota bacterium]|nr:hypothetical protein [Armatimonadota bacterium]